MWKAVTKRKPELSFHRWHRRSSAGLGLCVIANDESNDMGGFLVKDFAVDLGGDRPFKTEITGLLRPKKVVGTYCVHLGI